MVRSLRPFEGSSGTVADGERQREICNLGIAPLQLRGVGQSSRSRQPQLAA